MDLEPDRQIDHQRRIATLAAEIDQARARGERIGLRKSTSNLFRHRSETGKHFIDVRGFSRVLAIDPVDRAQPQGVRHTRHQQPALDRAARIARLHPLAECGRGAVVRDGGSRRSGGIVQGAHAGSSTHIRRAATDGRHAGGPVKENFI